MSLKVAILMDPIERIDPEGDSTFALALEAQARNHELSYFLPNHVSMKEGRIIARASPLKVRRGPANYFTLGAEDVIDLASRDVVLMRQDPPFDMSYITATHFLEHIHPKTLVVNDPAWGPDYDIRIVLQRLELGGVGRASVDGRDANRQAA